MARCNKIETSCAYEANNFRPFTGLGQVLIPSLSVGMFGAIDGLSGIFPNDGVKEKALQLQYIITKVDLMITELNVVGVKQLLKDVYGFGEIISGRQLLSNPNCNTSIISKLANI